MDLGLDGKRVVVTGASKGIGKSIAHAFLQEGARVMICARDAEVLAASAAELAELGEVHHRRADMAESADVTGFVDAAAETLGGIDVVVSNVSAFGGGDFAASYRVDIEAVQLLVRASLDHMHDHEDANIVCIGSRAGGVGVPPAWLALDLRDTA